MGHLILTLRTWRQPNIDFITFMRPGTWSSWPCWALFFDSAFFNLLLQHLNTPSIYTCIHLLIQNHIIWYITCFTCFYILTQLICYICISIWPNLNPIGLFKKLKDKKTFGTKFAYQTSNLFLIQILFELWIVAYDCTMFSCNNFGKFACSKKNFVTFRKRFLNGSIFSSRTIVFNSV